jgi:hypothetical protein
MDGFKAPPQEDFISYSKLMLEQGDLDVISKIIDGISQDIQSIQELFMSPMPSIGDMMNTVEQRGLEFEKDSGWSSKAGATRVGLLPTN